MEARDERHLLNLQRQLSRLNLLIIDELGFVPLSPTGAELLFEVFSQRYERGSILVATNLPFDEWTEVFGSERLTGALLGPAHPPHPHPGDERRELPPQAQPGELPGSSSGRLGQPISRSSSHPHSPAQPAASQSLGQFSRTISVDIYADQLPPGGIVLLRPTGMFCRRP